MQDNKYSWNEVKEKIPTDLLKTVVDETDLNEITARILYSRGLRDIEAFKAFLKDDPELIHDPYLMHDMDKAVNRIQAAVEKGERILVYGDYDADGVTSTSIMYEALDQVGANVEYFVPDRFKDGYGPNLEEYKSFISYGIQLIITVDNGVAGEEAINYAQENNVDVIVTDHHELPEKLPNAYAIVHPRYPESKYPFGGLSGVGVAFKVATALLEEIPEDYLDLYAVGTVADLVSMTDENRMLVKLGIQQLRVTQRPGLSALLKVAGINLERLDEQDIGFGIAPRLNALGRLSNANEAVELLTTLDEERATQLADDIDKINQKRQGIVQDIYADAKVLALTEENQDKQTLVIAGHDWHKGVLGIVASRIVELTNKPTIVLSDENSDGIYKGSGRSIESFNLFRALNTRRTDYESFGGHHMAVGISVKADKLEILNTTLEDAAIDEQLDYRVKPILKIDETIENDEVSEELIEQIKQLGPFGTDNPIPVFEFKRVILENIKEIGKNGGHLKFKFSQDGQKKSIDGIAFGRGELAESLPYISNDINIVGKLSLNEWQGNVSVQVLIDDLNVSGLQVVDRRTSNLNPDMFKESAEYIFFNEKLLKLLQNKIPNRTMNLYNDVTNLSKEATMVLVDCPTEVAQLKEVISNNHPEKIVTYFFRQVDYFAEGMPSRENFKQVFGLLNSGDIAKDSVSKISNSLRIEQNNVRFIINVFFELDFVKIENGLLSINRGASQHSLEEAPLYKQREQMIQTQGDLLYSSSADLTKLINNFLINE